MTHEIFEQIVIGGLALFTFLTLFRMMAYWMAGVSLTEMEPECMFFQWLTRPFR